MRMMTEFKIETVSQTARIVLDQCQTSQEENLIEYKNKLFRLITHIDTGYDIQSHGRLEYFNGTDFIRIASFSHDEIAEQVWLNHSGCDTCNHYRTTGQRKTDFIDYVKYLISRYESFMPHQEAKA